MVGVAGFDEVVEVVRLAAAAEVFPMTPEE